MIDEKKIDTEAVGCWFEKNVFKLTPYSNGYSFWSTNSLFFKKIENFTDYCFQFDSIPEETLKNFKRVIKENPNWVIRSLQYGKVNENGFDYSEEYLNVSIPDEDIETAFSKLKKNEAKWLD